MKTAVLILKREREKFKTLINEAEVSVIMGKDKALIDEYEKTIQLSVKAINDIDMALNRLRVVPRIKRKRIFDYFKLLNKQ